MNYAHRIAAVALAAAPSPSSSNPILWPAGTSPCKPRTPSTFGTSGSFILDKRNHRGASLSCFISLVFSGLLCVGLKLIKGRIGRDFMEEFPLSLSNSVLGSISILSLHRELLHASFVPTASEYVSEQLQPWPLFGEGELGTWTDQ